MNARLVVVRTEGPPSAPATPTTLALLPRLLTVEQTARAWQVSGRFVRDLIKRGAVPAIRIGRSVRVTRETVEKVGREGIAP
jgi:excisionase family DNA binding protein